MFATILIYLVFLVPDQPKPTLVLVKRFDTVKECQSVLAGAPKDQKKNYRCIGIDIDAKWKAKEA